MGGGGSAPAPDPNIGIAALSSAQTGQQMLDWMQQQAEITNQWAADDREREVSVFRPVQDRLVAEAENWDSPERMAGRVNQAQADVALAGEQQLAAGRRGASAMGVDPRSGRYAAQEGRTRTDMALGAAGAGNLARRSVENEAYQKRGAVVNMGAGLGVNPATSMGLSNQASQAGFGGAMQGFQQQGNLLNQDFQNRMSAYQANQSSLGAVGGALGNLAGAFLFGSSEEIKTDKEPYEGALGAVMDMPVEEWTYKEGEGDGGRHIGPYAEDFAKATGKGDGKTINVIDAIGVTMGAVRELSQKVDDLAANGNGFGAAGMKAAA